MSCLQHQAYAVVHETCNLRTHIMSYKAKLLTPVNSPNKSQKNFLNYAIKQDNKDHMMLNTMIRQIPVYKKHRRFVLRRFLYTMILFTEFILDKFLGLLLNGLYDLLAFLTTDKLSRLFNDLLYIFVFHKAGSLVF